jgi:mono/diheme cytochrome c family protein
MMPKEQKRMRRAWWVLLGVVSLALLLSACGNSSGAVAEGRSIYDTGGASQLPCATCHSLDGTDLVGPSFEGLGERAGERVAGLSAEEYIRQSILTPSAYVVPGFASTMPQTYSRTLSEEDIENLIAFVMEQ